MKKHIAILALLLPSVTNAIEVSPVEVGKIRTYSENQSSAAARRYSVFTIDSVIGNNKCLSLFIKPEDQGILSLLLFAKATASKILVGIDENAGAPWGDSGICPAYHVELL